MNSSIQGQQSKGIVLKRLFPEKQIVYIFDECIGLISLRLSDRAWAHRLWPGMYIEYLHVERGIHKDIVSFDILSVPTTNCYDSFNKLNRLLRINFLFMQKNIPYAKNYVLLLMALEWYHYEIHFFLDIERWICAVILQNSGYWNKNLFLVINTFFMKLSGLIDSFVQSEVELFHEWLQIINTQYADKLEIWIASCIDEHVHYE